MFIVATIFVFSVVAFIALVAYIVVRSNATKRDRAIGAAIPSPAQAMRMAKNMPSGDAMYTMMFPDIAPNFEPAALLEWHDWYRARKKAKQLIRDGRRWHGEVPGFPTAVTMSAQRQAPSEDAADQVILQNQAGETIADMLVDLRGDGSAHLTTPAGTFTLNPQAEVKVAFQGEGRGFEWKGPGLWRMNAPGGMPALDAQGGQVQMAPAASGVSVPAMAAGVAAGVAADMLAQQALAKPQQPPPKPAKPARASSQFDTDY